MNFIAGLDPGLDGAFCVIDGSRIASIIGIPVFVLGKGKGTKREIDVHALLAALREIDVAIDRVFVERVSASPQQGTVSAFKFGRGLGQVETAVIAMGWAIEYVTPQKWKRALALPAGATKDDSLHRASNLWPLDTHNWTPKRLVMNQAQCYGRAEAALIAAYGLETMRGPLAPIMRAVRPLLREASK